jgi:hypothetical protein
VERVEFETPGEFERLALRGQEPVVLTGRADVSGEDLTDLQVLAGRLATPALEGATTWCSLGSAMPPRSSQKPFAEFLADAPAGQSVLPEAPEPKLPGDDDPWGIWAFFGRDTATPAHYHPYLHAFVTELVGTKQIVLYPPEATSSIGLYPVHSFEHNQARMLPDDLPAWTCMLEPGDVLFIPVHWWHRIEGQGPTASVSCFYRAPLAHMSFPSPALRSLGALALREPGTLLRWLKGELGIG